MPKARIVRRIPHAPADLFNIVSDVERYPEFIDLIAALRVTKKVNDTTFEAEAVVAYKMIRETFRSLVKMDPVAHHISVEKAEKGGALKSLLNDWTFHALEDGSTLVDVIVDVRLKAYPLEYLLRDKFGKAAEDIMTMFAARAAQSCEFVGEPTFDSSAKLASLGLSREGLL